MIETIIAIFVLTTGLSSGLALAIFAFGASSSLTQRITATGLAREGVEIVRRMRDTNWLNGTLSDCGSNQKCYPDWLTAKYNISGAGGSGTVYRLIFNGGSATNKWTAVAALPTDDYRLYLDPDNPSYTNTATAQPTPFFRKVSIIYQDTTSPYTATSPLVLVQVTVWWWGKNCPQITYYNSPTDTSCRETTEEYITNWKNY